MPTTKQDHFYKFAQRNMGNQFSSIYQNITYKSAEIEQIPVNETEEYNFHSMKKNIKDQENVFVPGTKECNETIPLIIEVIMLLHLKFFKYFILKSN